MQRNNFMKNISELIGFRNSEYELVDIIIPVQECPSTFIVDTKNGLKRIMLMLTEDAFANPLSKQAEWQLAHECFHLFDPCTKQEGCALEEGLATWFQVSIDKSTKCWVGDPTYIKAQKVVERYTSNRNPSKSGWLLEAVKKLRQNGNGRRIHELTADDLIEHVSGMTKRDADILTAKFYRQGN